jgi:uncharacterized alkaline shock family protein YloU
VAEQSAPVLDEPVIDGVAPDGERGRLHVLDRAVESIVTAAVLSVPDVHRQASALGQVTGRGLPRVDVEVAGDRVSAHVEIAVSWGVALSQKTSDVHRSVVDALTRQAGLTVDRLTVHVAKVVVAERPRIQ